MEVKGKRIRVVSNDGTDSLPALMIPVEDRGLIIEGNPHDYGLPSSPTRRSSRVYWLGFDLAFEEVDEFVVPVDLAEHVRAYYAAMVAFQAFASPISLLKGVD